MKISLLPCLCLKEMQPVPVKEDMVFVQYLMDMKAWVCRCIFEPLSGKGCNGTVWSADWENDIWLRCDERAVTACQALPSLDEESLPLTHLLCLTEVLKAPEVDWVHNVCEKKWRLSCIIICGFFCFFGSDTCMSKGVWASLKVCVSQWLMYVFFCTGCVTQVCICGCVWVFRRLGVCGTGVCCVSNCFNSTWSLIQGN